MLYLNITITGCTDSDPKSPGQLEIRAIFDKLRGPLEELMALNAREGYYIQVSEDGLVDMRHRGAQNADEQTARAFLAEERNTLHGCDCAFCLRRQVVLDAWNAGTMTSAEATEELTRISIEQAAKEGSPLSYTPSETKSDEDAWRDAARDMGLD